MTNGSGQATVDELVAAFRSLCDEGLCSWMASKVELGTLRQHLGELIRHGATARTVREAYPVAKARLAKNRRPSGAAIARAMYDITEGRKPEPAQPEVVSIPDPGSSTMH
ncbi:hypothetical protein PPGU19_047990 [Paraburkholderia sp. PGU19]|uniref:hypothetical protein n=1 Tax=Paraburkholderia sp. PGU19 TaxID=2735434 RepID=UPI0015DB53BB|nr:hypothetical protein [Paraburkholderia sp. PGU19]BCG00231.1 hypothetical protein PPGU19_047990 [Paraburkholderia sp. PGU19]